KFDELLINDKNRLKLTGFGAWTKQGYELYKIVAMNETKQVSTNTSTGRGEKETDTTVMKNKKKYIVIFSTHQYFSLSKKFSSGIIDWLKNNIGRTPTIYDLPKIINESHLKAMDPANIVFGFTSVGISPFKLNVFDESNFLSVLEQRNIKAETETFYHIRRKKFLGGENIKVNEKI
ncbi:hypothetical protein HHI36_023985, partial [Cryptolaemus montrouzieri]